MFQGIFTMHGTLRKIALVVEGRVEYERNVLRGVREFAVSHPEWLIRLEPPTSFGKRFLEQWQPDGILFQTANLSEEGCATLRDFSGPRILVSDPQQEWRDSSYVGMNNFAVGEMAARYLQGLRRESVAFVGVSDSGFSSRRGDAFRVAMEAKGYPVQEMRLKHWNRRMEQEKAVIRFLKRLPKPCCLFATHDECALWLSTLCREADIRIPGSIAILGVDNDPLVCDLAWPRISSVEVPSVEIGRVASERLDSVFHDKSKGEVKLLLPPTRVVSRHSTDIAPTGDDHVNRALEYMRDHLGRGINVEDISRAIGVSRRLLERRFREARGASPLRELQRLRIDRAKWLLLETEIGLAEIAEQCGCSDASQLVVRFRRETGITPGEFRKQKSE